MNAPTPRRNYRNAPAPVAEAIPVAIPLDREALRAALIRAEHALTAYPVGSLERIAAREQYDEVAMLWAMHYGAGDSPYNPPHYRKAPVAQRIDFAGYADVCEVVDALPV